MTFPLSRETPSEQHVFQGPFRRKGRRYAGDRFIPDRAEMEKTQSVANLLFEDPLPPYDTLFSVGRRGTVLRFAPGQGRRPLPLLHASKSLFNWDPRDQMACDLPAYLGGSAQRIAWGKRGSESWQAVALREDLYLRDSSSRKVVEASCGSASDKILTAIDFTASGTVLACSQSDTGENHLVEVSGGSESWEGTSTHSLAETVYQITSIAQGSLLGGTGSLSLYDSRSSIVSLVTEGCDFLVSDGSSLFASSKEQSFKLWDVRKVGVPIRDYSLKERITSLSSARDETKTFFIGGEKGTLFQASSLRQHLKTRTITGASIQGVGGFPNGALLTVESSFEEGIWSRLWHGKENEGREWHVDSMKEQGKKKEFFLPEEEVSRIVISPDARHYVLAFSTIERMHIMDAPQRRKGNRMKRRRGTLSDDVVR